MQAYLVKRLLALIPALFFASLIVFVIVRLVPGNVIDMMLSQNDVGADKLSRDQLIATLEQIPRNASRRGFSWMPKADSIFATESGGWDGQAVQHGFA